MTGLQLKNGNYKDGSLYCLIDADQKLTYKDIDIDLITDHKYLLIAHGPASAG